MSLYIFYINLHLPKSLCRFKYLYFLKIRTICFIKIKDLSKNHKNNLIISAWILSFKWNFTSSYLNDSIFLRNTHAFGQKHFFLEFYLLSPSHMLQEVLKCKCSLIEFRFQLIGTVLSCFDAGQQIQNLLWKFIFRFDKVQKTLSGFVILIGREKIVHFYILLS